LQKTVKIAQQTFITALLCCCSISTGFSQAAFPVHIIKGTVTDSANQAALGYVTVALQETQVSQSAKNTLTREDGSFTIKGLPPKQYWLTFSYVGYKTKTIYLPYFTSATLHLGTITLAPTTAPLAEVQVLTQKQLVEHDLDKITYHVEDDPESNLLNTLDMLRKVPLLTVDADDNLQLNGNGHYQILVNGKRSSLLAGNPGEVLRGLPASAVKKVEVVTNPGARYEAAGATGIINIVTHQKSLSGYNGSLNLGAKSPAGYVAGGYLRAATGKFGFSGRYTTTTTTSPANRSNLLREDQARQNRLLQTGESSGNNQSQSLGSELSYEPNPQALITARYNRNRSHSAHDFEQQAQQLNTRGEITEAYRNLNQGKNQGRGQDLGLDYQRSFRRNDQQQLSLSFNLICSANKSTADFVLQPLLHYTGRESTTSNEDDAREYSAQADYVQPIGKQTLELGLKSIFQENRSDYFYKNRDSGTGALVPDPSQSNNFDYRQAIQAAYVSFSWRKGNWGLKSGLRLEETRLNARFRSSGTQATPEYRNLFPHFALSRQLKGSSTVKLSYSQGIERPGLFYLNPYADRTDPLNISYGNPDLGPATTHVFNLEYNTFVQGFSANAGVFHNFTTNTIQDFTTLGADSVARTTYGNLGRSQNYGFSVSGNATPFRKLSLNLNSSTQYVAFTSALEGRPQRNAGFTYNLRGSAGYRFGKNWRASGNLTYNSANVLLQGRTGGYTWSSLTLNKEFWKNKKASVSLSVRSPFQKNRRTVSEVYGSAFYQRRDSYAVVRQYSLSFTYRFRKL
jgi:outer membrane receptor protein involved in Fe transport